MRIRTLVIFAAVALIVAALAVSVVAKKAPTAPKAAGSTVVLPAGPERDALVAAIKSGRNGEFTSTCATVDAKGNCPPGSPVIESGHYGLIGNRIVHFAGVTDSGQWFYSGPACNYYIGNGQWAGCTYRFGWLFHQHYTHGTGCFNPVIPGVESGCIWENTIENQIVASWAFAHIHCDMAAAYGPTGQWGNETTAIIQATAIYQNINNGWNCDFDSVGLFKWTTPGGFILQTNHFLCKLQPNANGGAMALGKISA